MFLSLDCCEPSVSQTSDGKDVINWPATLIENTASQPCPNQDTSAVKSLAAKVWRKCVWNATLGSLWMPVNVKECSENVFSLKDLVHVSIRYVIVSVFVMLSTLVYYLDPLTRERNSHDSNGSSHTLAKNSF